MERGGSPRSVGPAAHPAQVDDSILITMGAMGAPTFDLQSHSTCSDGELPPERVVANAAEAGVELLALSDHDSVEGVGAALAAADVHKIQLVPATELSIIDPVGAGPAHLRIRDRRHKRTPAGAAGAVAHRPSRTRPAND